MYMIINIEKKFIMYHTDNVEVIIGFYERIWIPEYT